MAKLAVVTGASSGLGAEVASLLARRGLDLVLLNRSEAGSAATLARLRAESPDRSVEVVEADLADQDRVRAAAARIAERHPSIDALFNNAGVALPELAASRHGNDLHFQVNTLAPYMLARLLRGPLERAGDGGARVLNVSSGSIMLAGRLRLDELRRPRRMRKLVGPYAQSKLALTALTNALAPDYAAAGVVLRSADPGGNATKMTAGAGMPAVVRWLGPLVLKSPERGARDLVDAALDERFGSEAGLFIASGRVRRPPRDADDPAVQARLLELCAELTGV